MFVHAFSFVFSVVLCHLGHCLCFDLFLMIHIQTELPQCLCHVSNCLLRPPCISEPPSLSLLHLLVSFSEAGEHLLHVFCILMFKLIFLSLELSGCSQCTTDYRVWPAHFCGICFEVFRFWSRTKGNGHQFCKWNCITAKALNSLQYRQIKQDGGKVGKEVIMKNVLSSAKKLFAANCWINWYRNNSPSVKGRGRWVSAKKEHYNI